MEPTVEKPGLVKDTTYDGLKKTVQLYLPGLGTLYFALAQIWGLPAAEQVVGTIAAVTVFLSLLLGLSSKAYSENEGRFDGEVVVIPSNVEGEGDVLGLSAAGNPQDWAGKDEVVLKVKTVS